ncbi:hypothetical protein L5515_009204 [Caenorhabditis briggsae]|uniref:Uncharacterized protein n=1 Tax=Caenorhabditis briggsae TaxID=6238 RepID=A0AAE9F890_CAEBR|nr:hypothetical protein L5515_009204 [Caenorhabditis briggsae]
MINHPLALIVVFVSAVMCAVVLLTIFYSLKHQYKVRLQRTAIHMVLDGGGQRLVRRIRSYERESDEEMEQHIPLEFLFA